MEPGRTCPTFHYPWLLCHRGLGPTVALPLPLRDFRCHPDAKVSGSKGISVSVHFGLVLAPSHHLQHSSLGTLQRIPKNWLDETLEMLACPRLLAGYGILRRLREKEMGRGEVEPWISELILSVLSCLPSRWQDSQVSVMFIAGSKNHITSFLFSSFGFWTGEETSEPRKSALYRSISTSAACWLARVPHL